jgi:alpha-galactosidase
MIRPVGRCCVALALLLFTTMNHASHSRELYLNSCGDLALVQQDWGKPQAGKSVDGNPLRIGGRSFERGVGTHANSLIVVDLKGAAASFTAMVGVDDETEGKGTVVFSIWADGKKLVDSGVLRAGDAPKELSTDLRGKKRLWLRVDDAEDGIHSDHADWAEARFALSGDARPEIVAVSRTDSPVSLDYPKIASSKSRVEPRINGPRVIGTTPGRPFLFRIPATGERPLKFAAKNLPAGLQLDENTGIITGTVRAAGETVIELRATNARGTSKRNLKIVAGQHKLALTPPMGWNSWNVWGTSVDAEKVKAAADAMVSSGLADHGYQFVNIDDAWEGQRDANGEIRTNEKFPDMKALADYVHSKGLKLGIYSSPGPKTCAGYEGSFEHEEQDARTWAAWGIDYLKYDWCSCKSKDLKEPYRVMRRALDAVDRDIVYSLCQYGMGDVWTWGADVGGNLWRTTGDIYDSWGSMAGIGFKHHEISPHARPGAWNDPDMLVVGKVGWGPTLRDSRLAPIEQQTHITLWALLAAPLLIGCDMTQMDPFTIDLLTNDEVIDVNQDELGKAATRVWKDGELEVWSRPLHDGTVTVGLFNRGYEPAEVTARWSDLGVDGSQHVRDLWQKRDVGRFDGSFSSNVPGHGSMLIKVGTPRDARR